METEDRRAAFGAWMGARLSRAKRIVSFDRLWRKVEKARALPPDEAAEQLARHKSLIEQLAPETIGDG